MRRTIRTSRTGVVEGPASVGAEVAETVNGCGENRYDGRAVILIDSCGVE